MSIAEHATKSSIRPKDMTGIVYIPVVTRYANDTIANVVGYELLQHDIHTPLGALVDDIQNIATLRARWCFRDSDSDVPVLYQVPLMYIGALSLEHIMTGPLRFNYVIMIKILESRTSGPLATWSIDILP